MFKIISVDSSQQESVEPLGAKRKFWFTDCGRRILFKAEDRGTGEDWAEKIASELCTLLELPHVYYELAELTENGEKTPGVVCESCAPQPTELILGNQLLLQRDPNYPSNDEHKYKVQKHTIDAVADILKNLQPPQIKLPEGIKSALDVFVGYVMLDAWIANQDRHHQNWGALYSNKILYLAPTFDHGASLARNLTDEERQKRLYTRDARQQIGFFAQKARSAFYKTENDTKSLTTLEAWLVFSQHATEASIIWKERLLSVDDDKIQALFKELPPHRISDIGCEFTHRLLKENKQRILERNIV